MLFASAARARALARALSLSLSRAPLARSARRRRRRVARSSPTAKFQPPRMPRADVLVLGAGVSGLATALALAEMRVGRVVVAARRLSPHTTSDVAGAIWEPYLINAERDSSERRWWRATYQRLLALRARGDARETGVTLVAGYKLNWRALPPPSWRDDVMGFREVSASELQSLGWGAYAGAWHFASFVVDSTRHLAWLTAQLAAHNVSVLQLDAEANDLATAARAFGARVVINCTGLGGRALAGDAGVVAVRGCVALAHAPALKYFVIDDDHPDGLSYALPRADGVILGGSAARGDEDAAPRAGEAEAIVARCRKLCPELRDCAVRDVRVGLRPWRVAVRVEAEAEAEAVEEEAAAAARSGGVSIVHNYGHGGAGWTLHWGCALEAAALAAAALRARGARL
jgi:D-amino-acid oxidase